ncbi:MULTISPECIES: hypothetical protein [Streptomyces]|uniref:Uncharacterized protein n=1 Tax=Streptomyces flaveolus TaxID=67297 RepID=A0ABV3AMH8_9ACTN|nr:MULTISPECIES: hypothetical protein [Streptomyces]
MRWLDGYRDPAYQAPPRLRAALAEAFAVPWPLAEGAPSVGDPLQVLPAVYHALWCGHLRPPLDEPLHEWALICADAEGGEGVERRLSNLGGDPERGCAQWAARTVRAGGRW